MLAYYYLAFATFTDGELDDSEKAMILAGRYLDKVYNGSKLSDIAHQTPVE